MRRTWFILILWQTYLKPIKFNAVFNRIGNCTLLITISGLALIIVVYDFDFLFAGISSQLNWTFILKNKSFPEVKWAKQYFMEISKLSWRCPCHYVYSSVHFCLEVLLSGFLTKFNSGETLNLMRWLLLHIYLTCIRYFKEITILSIKIRTKTIAMKVYKFSRSFFLSNCSIPLR